MTTFTDEQNAAIENFVQEYIDVETKIGCPPEFSLFAIETLLRDETIPADMLSMLEEVKRRTEERVTAAMAD